jgi:two-component system sensor histidine kinase/response regulator
LNDEKESPAHPRSPRRLEGDGPHSRHERTVAICDDNEDIVYVMTAALRGKYNVLTAKSGRGCVSLFDEETRKGNKIDVLFLDYRLDDMSGEQVARSIKAGNRQLRTKIVLITAFELDKVTISRLFEESLIDSELRKPFSLADFDKKLAELVG